ncbi:MAG: hypothetical protein BGO67_01875 [Alphaproteobacteria bacterium 41-28]|nr:MAG: hypothetical protein BGO67_01875 [Alphaproteobacteria bacterium 41-28]
MEGKVRTSAYFVIALGVCAPFGLEAAVELQPHRAYYSVSMVGRPTLNTNVTEVRGTMMLELNKVCGGWTVQQLSEIRRYHDDDTVEHIRWGYVTFEADDGSHFMFNTFRKTDEELVEDIRGTAGKKGKLIEAFYQKPKKMTLRLPEGVLFPIQHTIALLKAAEEGGHMFPQIVFDGSTTEGASQINTFIGAQKIAAGNSASKEDRPFVGQPFWPVRFSVYGLGKTDYEPDYVTTQDLLSNGIIKKYVIDDGTLKIQGVLERIELLSKDEC